MITALRQLSRPPIRAWRIAIIVAATMVAATPNASEPKAQQASAFADQDLYMSSRGTNSVRRYDGQTGVYLGDFVSTGSGGLSTTQEVLFGPDGHLYVSGRRNRHIKKYDGLTGEFIGDFTNGFELDEPTKMSFGPDGRLYVSQWGETTQRIARFDASTGAFVDQIPTSNLNQPMDHAWDANGTLHVASFGSGDVRRFDSDGNEIDVSSEDRICRLPSISGLTRWETCWSSTRLLQNYPNPFSTTTTISFTLIEPGRARLSIHDLLGRQLSAPLDRSMGPGTHEVTLSAEGLPPGVYMARLRSASVHRYRTLVVLR